MKICLQKYLNFFHVWTIPICKVCISFTFPHFVPYIENCTYNGYISILRVADWFKIFELPVGSDLKVFNKCQCSQNSLNIGGHNLAVSHRKIIQQLSRGLEIQILDLQKLFREMNTQHRLNKQTSCINCLHELEVLPTKR